MQRISPIKDNAKRSRSLALTNLFTVLCRVEVVHSELADDSRLVTKHRTIHLDHVGRACDEFAALFRFVGKGAHLRCLQRSRAAHLGEETLLVHRRGRGRSGPVHRQNQGLGE